MKSFLLISFFLAFATAQTAVKCPNSSKLWCDNLKNARACGVTKQCMDHVWFQLDAEKPPVDTRDSDSSKTQLLTPKFSIFDFEYSLIFFNQQKFEKT